MPPDPASSPTRHPHRPPAATLQSLRCPALSAAPARSEQSPVPPAAASAIRLPVSGLCSGGPGGGVGTVLSPFIWTTVPVVGRAGQSPPMLLTVSLPPSADPGGPRASPLPTTAAGWCSPKSPAPTAPEVPAASAPHPQQSPLMWPFGQVQSCLPPISRFRREDFLSGLDWW